MHKIYILSFVAFAAVTISCKENTETRASTEKQIPVEKNNGNGSGAPTLEEAFRQNIERAHHKQQFLEQPAIAFDLDINFNDTDRFDARITMLTNTGKIHMDKPDGSSLIYTGEKA
ncbi:MAG: hypothetical protein WA951_12330, partial [Leeuwenhoekiella sp.]